MFTHLISGDLAKSELFRRKSYLLPWEDRVRLSYERARALTHAYGAFGGLFTSPD